jgi:putative oxygen-independent coproporphyrinogen III oxidase
VSRPPPSGLSDDGGRERVDHPDRRRRAEAGLYVHVPFCLTRCGYCDFNAYAGLDARKPRYAAALEREAELVAPGWRGTRIASIFVGGGTPTTLDPAALGDLLRALRGEFDVASDAEVSVEANPDTVDRARLERLLEDGFTRLSMGAQSFDPLVLAALERLHGGEAVRRAVDAARAAGFANVNIDLIYGAAGETIDSWGRTLEEAISLAPDHVAAYALTIEPATPLGRRVSAGAAPPPDPDLQADMYMLACEMLEAARYRHYEVSNWARPGYDCRHNLGYWERRPYLGLGAGAHSYRSERRWWNIRPPEEYLHTVEAGRLPIGGDEVLDSESAHLEEVFLRLRTFEGVPVEWVDVDRAAPLVDGGLLLSDDRVLVPSERGMLLLNDVVLSLTA